jgi:hypothetical protein
VGERLAASVQRDGQQQRVWFAVSEMFIDRVRADAEWSEPVQFRFEQDEFGRWDLVMRKVGGDGNREPNAPRAFGDTE